VDPQLYVKIAQTAQAALTAFHRCALIRAGEDGTVELLGAAPSVRAAFSQAGDPDDAIAASPWASSAMREMLGMELFCLRPLPGRDGRLFVHRALPDRDAQSVLWQRELTGLLNSLLDGADETQLVGAAQRVVDLSDVLEMAPDWVTISVIANLARCGIQNPQLHRRAFEATTKLLRGAPDAFARHDVGPKLAQSISADT